MILGWWFLGCLGFAIYITISSNLFYFFITLLMGQQFCKYSEILIETDFEEAAANDDLNKTVDYTSVTEIVKQQMAVRSKLIEHAGQRICDDLLKRLIRIQSVKVRVTKIRPPVNFDVESVGIEIYKKR